MTQAGSIPTMLAISVPAALIGAASFGLGNAAQQLVARQTPMVHMLDPRLFLRLVRRPLWVLGVLAIVAGVSLQFVALAFGPLILVQPLLVSGLLFAVTFSAWMMHRRVDRVIVFGCLLCVVGLASSLALARPRDTGPGLASGGAVLALVVALGTVVAASLVLATRARGMLRTLALALATGVLFGATAGLMKVVGSQVRVGGPAEPLGHWALYLVCLVGPMGFLLSQNTFQQGVGFASALATIRTVDPVVGVAIGVSWLGETVVLEPAVLAGEAVAAAMVVVGIAVLARRSSQLRRPVGSG